MTKRQPLIIGIIGLVLGIIGGVAGTAYALGAEKQRINSTFEAHALAMKILQSENSAHEKAVQNELDRFVDLIASPISVLQSSVAHLTRNVADLRTDVQVVKALMERMEDDLKSKQISD